MTIQSGRWKTTKALCLSLFVFLLITFCGCKSATEIYTVGIASWDVDGNKTLAGFMNGMTERGYIEGENVRYLYEIIPVGEFYNRQYIAGRLKEFMKQDLDLLVTMGLEVSLEAKVLTEGTDLPVLFSGNIDPVGNGLVDSLLSPGGNMTGVRFVNTIPKALEWLETISGGKKIYVPFDPSDNVSIECLRFLNETADQLRVELAYVEVSSVEEAVEAMENLPPDAGSVYRVPSPLLDPRSSELSQAAIRRRMPMCAPHRVDDVILATFANDEVSSGKMLARLAGQIDQGAKPLQLPVETIEAFLTINLNTAEKIGLDIPDVILTQAKTIVN